MTGWLLRELPPYVFACAMAFAIVALDIWAAWAVIGAGALVLVGGLWWRFILFDPGPGAGGR